MSLLNENVVTLAKVETVYGTDSVPTGLDGILTSQVKITPFESQTTSRDIDKPGSGSDLELTTDYWAMIEFKVELTGSGTLGLAPAYGRLLKACRCSETIVATTSVAYRPLRSSTTSLSIYFHLDGNRHIMTGARGTFKIEVSSQGIPYLVFTFWGLYNPPTSAALPATVAGWDDFKMPTPINYENTPVPTLHGYSNVLKTFNFDQGNEVVPNNNPGEKEILIVRHASKGSITMLAPLISTKDFFTIAKNSTLGAMKVTHGLVPNTKWIFDCPGNTVQVSKPRYGDDQGRVTLEADLIFVPTNAQNDEWELRFAAA
jgi:hypothetical protein